MHHDDWGTRDKRWAGIRSDTIDVVGHPVSVLRADPVTPSEPSSELPILLVHGLGGAATNWLDVMVGLAASAPVVAVDLPGFAETEPPTPRAARMRPQVQFLRHLLDALGWPVAEVHGNSMGGLLSILLAGTQPDRVARLVLAAPAVPSPVGTTMTGLHHDVLRRFLPFMASRRVGLALLRNFYGEATAEQIFLSTESLVMGTAVSMRPALRQVGVEHAVNAMARPWRSDSLSHATSDLLAHLSLHRREVDRALDAITADVLLVWGEQDRLVRHSAMEALTARRADVERHDLPGVGHVPMIEAPDDYLDLVTTWRAAHPA